MSVIDKIKLKKEEKKLKAKYEEKEKERDENKVRKEEEVKEKPEEMEKEEEGITRFGVEITEKEWKGVTRFGDASPVEQITKFTSEGSYMEVSLAQKDMHHLYVLSSVLNHNNDEERICEYEPVRVMTWGNMSVIQEVEEEEDEEEDEEQANRDEEVFENMTECEVREVGKAWEEMTYSEAVQLREAAHRREIHKTVSMVSAE